MKKPSFPVRPQSKRVSGLMISLTVAMTISGCGPAEKKKVPVDSGKAQALGPIQLAEDQPVSDASMELLARDWKERPALPAHQRVKLKTKVKPFLREGVEMEGPQIAPAPSANSDVPPLVTGEQISAGGAVVPDDHSDETDSVIIESPQSPPTPVPSVPTSPDRPPEPTSGPVSPTRPPSPPADVQPETPKLPPVPAESPVAADPKPNTPEEVPAQEVLDPVDPQVLTLDSSYRTLRARIFPHVYVPAGDPFKISQKAGEAQLSNEGGLILLGSDQRVIAEGKLVHFFFDLGVVKVGSQQFPLSSMTVVPRSEQHLTRIPDLRVSIRGVLEDANHYRGKFKIAKVKIPLAYEKKKVIFGERWSVINYVDFEDYVAGVVPVEIGYSEKTIEAVRAQAIAVRTFGAYQALRAREQQKQFDVESTTFYQVYGGVRGEWHKVTVEVDATQGQILVQGSGGAAKVICANYGANSGGHTCSSAECQGQSLSYLLARPDVDGVRGNSNGQRHGVIQVKNAVAVLQGMKVDQSSAIKNITNISILERTESDRVRRLRVVAVTADRTDLAIDLTEAQTKAFREYMGLVRYVDFGAVDGGKMKITVYGAGPGIGLSQDGAVIMAKQGRSASQILSFYYANTRITKLGISGGKN